MKTMECAAVICWSANAVSSGKPSFLPEHQEQRCPEQRGDHRPGRGQAWAARGCEVAVAEMGDVTALIAAFSGAEAVFILPPSEFDPEPGYPEERRVISAVVAALAAAQPVKVLCLSTIGADAPHDNLLTQRTLMEQALSALPMPITFLRPAWFIDNAAWDVASARDEGVIRTRPTVPTQPHRECLRQAQSPPAQGR